MSFTSLNRLGWYLSPDCAFMQYSTDSHDNDTFVETSPRFWHPLGLIYFTVLCLCIRDLSLAVIENVCMKYNSRYNKHKLS